jgi:hypothetical protein
MYLRWPGKECVGPGISLGLFGTVVRLEMKWSALHEGSNAPLIGSWTVAVERLRIVQIHERNDFPSVKFAT